MAQFDLAAVNDRIASESAFVDQLLTEISRVVVGQRYMIERLMIRIGKRPQATITREGVAACERRSSLARLYA